VLGGKVTGELGKLTGVTEMEGTPGKTVPGGKIVPGGTGVPGGTTVPGGAPVPGGN